MLRSREGRLDPDREPSFDWPRDIMITSTSTFRVDLKARNYWFCVVQTAGRLASCRLQRAVILAALRGADGRSCRFQRAVLADLCSAGFCLYSFRLLIIVYMPIYIKLGLVVGMTNKCQMVRR